ncbi:hypothetical protein COL36_10360 [Bacillus wiedmannii]|uniref:hypothetical protein n=1 Tax=Bacillus wiedmannii TaxID=1890302 RepID=UPI000BF61060|nr:hypothetical protein [Bacillus wiedmannii]PFX61604.1 hypothetical protein COL36_10360 [Bacillus wiedmannii]
MYKHSSYYRPAYYMWAIGNFVTVEKDILVLHGGSVKLHPKTNIFVHEIVDNYYNGRDPVFTIVYPWENEAGDCVIGVAKILLSDLEKVAHMQRDILYYRLTGTDYFTANVGKLITLMKGKLDFGVGIQNVKPGTNVFLHKFIFNSVTIVQPWKPVNGACSIAVSTLPAEDLQKMMW